MKKTIVIGLFILSSIQIYAQNLSDSIGMQKGTWGVYHRINLTNYQLKDLTKPHTEARRQMNIANTYNYWGTLFIIIGAVSISEEIFLPIFDKNTKINWLGAVCIDVGSIGLSFLFESAYYKHKRKAIRLYNQGLNQTGMNKVDFRFGLTNNGIGIKMKF